MRALTRIALATLLASTATSAFAEKLQVVTSIRPIHSLVEYISQSHADVSHLVPANASPHNYALKPSDAKKLQDADVIFWIDEHMETFLEKAIDTLPKNDISVTLAEQPGIIVFDNRELDLAADHHDDEHAHEEHEHDEGHEHEEDHEHEDEHDHDAEHEAHDGHDEHEGHDHGEHDLHIWLDPENAKTIANVIAKTLGEKDPEHASLYIENAQKLSEELDILIAETATRLAPVKDKRFVTFHDAYQYYEKRFDIQNVGVVTLSPDIKPGAKRLKELKEALGENKIACVFSEPQFDAKLVSLAVEGTNVQSAELDPLGANLDAGASLYIELVNQLTDGIVGCLSKAQ